MDLANYFPVCDMITEDERKKLCSVAVERVVPQGTLLHSGESDCVGLLVICAGQLRAVITSDDQSFICGVDQAISCRMVLAVCGLYCNDRE